ncbi:ABC transporter ATP-binding protein [Streptomyces sp. BHT-5-2]|uniref:ABC transporter ATP-binding protein n=1 Tax=Streptomyces sp. BHT-5-2 TaxID=2866715 RepID=UPI001C8E094A|nr:ABC transporter ATP-binding protein [Streptomyces sp. BHT-5-2]QZL06410.1 ABC transporter ATP-binding protein [Streptomyces sp. BHT-5-2]
MTQELRVPPQTAAAAPARAAVEVRDLVKKYPKRAVNAVDGLSFTVAPGEVFGLLGPNGAGKSTTLGILTTRIVPTSGAVFIGGVDVSSSSVEARCRLGVVPQHNNLDRSLSARHNLLFHAAYHGVPRKVRLARADELLDVFGLGDRAEDRVDSFSGGMVQRLMIARALIHEPEVLFLDEPSTGLDPQARLFVWDRVEELRSRGVTIVLTTHDMEEAAELSDRVAIVDHGRILALNTPEELARTLGGQAVLDITVNVPQNGIPDGLLTSLCDLDSVQRVECTDASATATDLRLYTTQDPAAVLVPVTRMLADSGTPLSGVRVGRPTLEDVFIQLTGRGLR